MNSLDLVIFIPILIGFAFGLFKGLIKELTGLAAVILGIIMAIRFEPQVSRQLLKIFDLQPSITQAIAYALVFIAVALVLLILAKLLNKLLSDISLGGANAFFGGVFGALKYALIVSVLLNVFNLLDKGFDLIKPETKNNSISYGLMLNLGPKLWSETKDFFELQSAVDEDEDEE